MLLYHRSIFPKFNNQKENLLSHKRNFSDFLRLALMNIFVAFLYVTFFVLQLPVLQYSRNLVKRYTVEAHRHKTQVLFFIRSFLLNQSLNLDIK